jgi:hypothetical protein
MTDAEVIMKYITNGMRILTTRLLLIFTLLLTFSLFVWAMLNPDPYRWAIATTFTIFVFMPIKRSDKGDSNVE